MSSWHLNPILDSYLLVAISIGILLALLLLGPAFGTLTRRRRMVLVSLRITIILAVLFALLRPTWRSEQRQPQPRTLILLLDESRSMQVSDDSARGSRWKQLREAADIIVERLADRPEELQVKVYTFATGPELTSLEDLLKTLPESPEGAQSDLATSLDEAIRRELGSQIAGVVLVSDGAQRAFAPRIDIQQAVYSLVARKKPLYTLTLGEARDVSELGDVSIEGLSDHYTLFVKNEMRVRGSMLVQGRFINQEIPVELLLEHPDGSEEVIHARPYSVSQSGDRQQLDIGFTPQEAGQYKITLSAEPLEGELVTENNSISAFVTVLEGGIKALYIDANPGWQEQKFIYRALDEAADIDIDYFAFNNQDPAGSRRDLEPLIGESLHDVYLLGDVSASALGADVIQALVDEVSSGKGLMMHGGYFTFGPGGYARTPLAEVLPIELGRIPQDPNRPILEQLHLGGEVVMQPVLQPHGKPHFIMRLGSFQQTESRWKQLPPLRGANRLGNRLPRSQLLAETPEGEPLLVAGDFGGRVLTFAGDSTWRWWRHGEESAHRQFWRQAVLWLARKDESVQDDVWIQLNQRRYPPGARIDLYAGARSSDGQEILDAQLNATVTLPDGTQQNLPLAQEGDQWRGFLPQADLPGDYQLEVTAQLGQRSLGQAKANFLVYDEDLELTDSSANPGLMRSLASETSEFGGRTLAPEQLGELLDEIKNQEPDEEISIEVQWQLADTAWDAWLFHLLLVGLLGAEWFCRKKWGLV